MKIKQLTLNNLEECEKWENFVFANGYLYQSYKWAEIFKKSYNIDYIYLYLESNEKIISALPLFHVKLPFIKNELVSSPHLEAGGLINVEYYKYFLDYIYKNQKIKNLKIYQFKDSIENFPKNELNSLFMVDMPPSYDMLLKYLKKGFKRSVKNLLSNSEIEIEKGNNEKLIYLLYYFNVLKSKEFGIPHHPYIFFKNLVETFKNNCEIFVAKKNSQPIGASFIIYYNKIGYHIFHFIPEKFLKLKTGLILYAYLFKESFYRGMEKFSFGRSPKGSGVYKFKMQMKATPYPLYIYNFTFKEGKIRAEKIQAVNEKFSWGTVIWRKLPKSLTDFMSPKLRKWVY